MIPTATQQQPMFAQIQPAMKPVHANPLEKYKTLLFSFGITEIVLGGISFLLGATTFILEIYYISPLTLFGNGMWCGSVLIACGILGVMTRTRPTRSMYIANMAMSIVAAHFVVALTILTGMSAALNYNSSLLIAFVSTICLAAFAALIITIIHSAYCCAGVCCLRRYPRQVVVLEPNGMMPVQLADKQTVPYPHPNGYTTPNMVSPNTAVNMLTTRVSFSQSMQPNSMSIGQPTQSTSVQVPVSSNAPTISSRM